MSNAQFTKVADVSELPPEGEAREFQIDGRQICVANVDGKYYALDNVCPHQGGPLGMGYLEGKKLVCPWHGWEFDATTGKLWHTDRPGVAVFELLVERGSAFVKL